MTSDAAVGQHRLDRRRLALGVAACLAGMPVLGLSLNAAPGSGWFYLATVGLAAVWFLGALVAGPGPPGRLAVTHWRRRAVEPVVLGVALAAAFILAGVMIDRIDILADAADDVLDYARQGSGPLVLLLTATTGIAEELLFRGALYDTLPRQHATTVSTSLYVVATLASGRLVLAFAALVVGAVLGLQRGATGGFTAPAITHVTWSLTTLLTLPLVINE